MGSKAVLLLALLVATFLLISSQAAARHLAKTFTEKQNAKGSTQKNGLDDGTYGSYSGGQQYGRPYNGGGYGYNPGGGYGTNPSGGYGTNPGGGYGYNPGRGYGGGGH